MDDTKLEQLVSSIRKSNKYQTVSLDLIKAVGTEELIKRKNLKEAIKSTKNVLHQLAGAFFNSRPAYDEWLDEIRQASGDISKAKEVARRLMAYHISTYERLQILDDLSTSVFADLPEIHSVIDIACGLNPLAVHWMNLAPNTQYFAYDIYDDLMAFHEQALRIWGFQAEGIVCDVTDTLPTQKADLAIIFKAIPCLQNRDKFIGEKIINEVNARYLLISFPSQSLTGIRKGMDEHYESSLMAMVSEDRGWTIKKYDFSTENFYLIDKGAD